MCSISLCGYLKGGLSNFSSLKKYLSGPYKKTFKVMSCVFMVIFLLIPCSVVAHDKDLNCVCKWSYSDEEIVITCTGSGPAVLGSNPMAQ